ncbi:Hypothetical predicted protein [Cloeon dipterum]|uniref:Neurotransmitter-gated ion-channel ligand-binding domain-containing protein n=1 Tax=Cloeon dipterum TaxID=197152 RepID=A0A8S1DZW7_9INSE|nr:Hypothetical predicted protein [Cloeon dipterum]
MASPLCITLVVIIIIVISSEVKTVKTLSLPAASKATESQKNPFTNNATSTRTVSACSLQFTLSYGYNRFHQWSTFAKSSKATDGSTSSWTLKFKVRAASDAHILLTTDRNTTLSMPVYEIVLGAGRNSFSDLRRLQRTGTRSTLPTADILSPLELRGFWIRLSSDGFIGVGKEGDDVPFLAWRDPEPLKIQYFSFCTWNGVFGRWEFNCPENENSQSVVCPVQPAVTEVEEENDSQLSDESRLRKHLFTNYDHYSIPSANNTDIIDVKVLFLPQQAHLFEPKYRLTVVGTLSLVWTDQKLNWNPEKYGGINSIVAQAGKVWVPELILYDAANGKGDELSGSLNKMFIDHNGTVQWTHVSRMEVLCPLDLHFWPFDHQNCHFVLGVWGLSDRVSIWPLETEYDQSVAVEQHGTEWDIVSFQMHSDIGLLNHPYFEDKYYNYDDANSDDSTPTTNPAIEFWLTLRRNNGIYTWTLFAPLDVVHLFMCASFWLETHRLIICLMNLLITVAFMMNIFKIFPGATQKTPGIITVYADTMIVATFTILITIAVTMMRSHTFKAAPPVQILKAISIPGEILKSISKQGVLRRRPIFVGSVGTNHSLLDNDAQQESNDESPESQQSQWNRVADAIDNFAFVVISLICAFAIRY